MNTMPDPNQELPCQPSRRGLREPFSSLSHLAGAALSVIGLIVLLGLAQGRIRHLIGFGLYGASLILLYTISAVYHARHGDVRQTARLQRLDHIAIYLLIAGTYAPLCLIALEGTWRWGLLGAVYGIALAGILILLIWQRAPHWVRVVLYVGMGWLGVIALPTLRGVLPPAAIGWLIAGGVVYTSGIPFYATERPKIWPGKFEGHDIWHLFVLGGSACHFVLVAGFLARIA